MASLWTFLNDRYHRPKFLNPAYNAQYKDVLYPETHSPAMMCIWKTYYMRFFARHPRQLASAFGASVDMDELERIEKSDLENKQQHHHHHQQHQGEEGNNVASNRLAPSGAIGILTHIDQQASSLQFFDDYESGSHDPIPLMKPPPQQQQHQCSSEQQASVEDESSIANMSQHVWNGVKHWAQSNWTRIK